jgi:hypothetical protein
MEPVEKHPRYEEALCHVREVRGFYTHLLVYVLVIGGLAALNLATNPGRLWFAFAAFGWGLGLLVHGLSIFALRGWLGREWQARKVREYLERNG